MTRPSNDIAQRRLATQHLLTPTLTDPAEVVRRLGAVQAQDYGSAKWGVGTRTRGAVDAAVERAVNEGSMLRTHVLRPTWHFVTPADIRWMLALTAPRIKAAMAYYDRQQGLDAALFRRSNSALTRALRDGNQLTRAEVAMVLRRARVDATGPERLGRLLMRAELEGIVCSGARRGKQGTYALLDERAPRAAPLDRDEALLELTGRYFATRGPATVRDLAWWAGLTVADAGRGMEIAGGRLEREVIGDETYWLEPATRPSHRRSPTAHLLPNYDEYFIGFKNRSAIGERLSLAEGAMVGAALRAHVIVVDGQLVGGWKRTLTKAAVVVELTLLVRLTKPEREAVVEAAQALGDFLQLPVELGGL